jgi:hypothetical protein
MTRHLAHGVVSEQGFLKIRQRMQDPISRIFFTSIFRASVNPARAFGFCIGDSGEDEEATSLSGG